MNEELKELYNQYIYEKSLVEMWGHQSVVTFEEWLEIKKKRDERNMESRIANAIFRRDGNIRETWSSSCTYL